ncbi:hypothetical protein SAMN05428978_11065 [Nitrosomonas sp. Nm34]|nr:hypothetical protein SAMN05428978_11065 [Nitrosomonas sp. Nm34]
MGSGLRQQRNLINEQAPRQDVLFHKHFGCCLMEEMIEGGMYKPTTFWN